MCGRYVLKKKDLEALIATLGVKDVRDFASRYNIGPGTAIPAIRPRRGGQREAVVLNWGLVPSWSREARAALPLANARAESVAAKPAFRSAFRRRRCVVPASGFYEWQTIGKLKHPWYFHFADERPFFFAALWEAAPDPGDAAPPTCALLTTAPNALVGRIHDRMPVILRDAAVDRWLDPAIEDPAELAPLLVPAPAGAMDARPVSPLVNNIRHDGPDLLARTEPPAPPPPDSQLTLF